MRTSVIAMVLLGACTVDGRTVQLPGEPTQHSATSFDIPQGIQVGYDILVVVDSSSAMGPHAAGVIPQLGTLFSQLAQHGDPDWHLAVVTSDLGGPGCSAVGDDGVFRHDGLVGSPFLIEWRHLDDRRTANYQGELADAFARLASVGTAGCARQQPLAAVRRALEQPRDAGFRRDDANLVVVIVSGGDDASPGHINEHVEGLRDLAPNRRLLIAGVYDGPAPRLDTVIAAFPNEARVAPLRSDLAESLRLRLFSGGSWSVACLEGAIGPVPECSISDVIVEDEVVVHETLIPRCDGTQSVKPCWHIEIDPQNCPAWSGSEGMTLEVERRDYPPIGTHLRGSCVTK